jgi:hypothetical protein
MKYVIGILMIVAGVAFIMKTDWFVRSFGRVGWAEDKLGYGGTWSFYKLLGVGVIILALMIMTGDILSILDFVFAR